MTYTSPPMRAGMHALALSFPFWGVILPTALALFIVLLLSLPANVPLTYSLTIIGSLLLVILLCTAAAIVCDDEEIYVSKEGLSFPLRFLPALKWKRQFKWDELGSAMLKWHRNATFSADEALTLCFDNGGVAPLQLKNLKPAELEQFFIGFEACANRCKRDAEIPDFEEAIQNRSGGVISQTQLWEKSLALRFSGATFTPLEPNAVLQEGRFKILKQIGFGGFAAVYLARGADGRFIVLKESSFPQDNQVQSKASELFKREAELLSKLDHANIAKMKDYFLESGRHYLVLEHVDGIDLNRLVLQRGAQSVETVANFARQIAQALKYLHEQSPSIVHRDLTPDNLLLRNDGSIMLIDFGAAKEIVSSFTGTIIGKQSYIAPEQFKGKPTPKSDIFSLGATIYFLLTGQQPEPLTQSQLPDAGSTAVQSAYLKEKLAELIWRCTNLEQSLRPDSEEILQQLDTSALWNSLATVETPVPSVESTVTESSEASAEEPTK